MESDPTQRIQRIQRIQKQLPSEVSTTQIEEALRRCNDDEIDAVCMLMDIDSKCALSADQKAKNEIQQKWKQIRDICDTFDSTLDTVLKKST